MPILLTGGAGYIGSHTAVELLNKGKELVQKWKIVCPHCNSVLEYSKDDVIIHESYFFYLHYIKRKAIKY